MLVQPIEFKGPFLIFTKILEKIKTELPLLLKERIRQKYKIFDELETAPDKIKAFGLLAKKRIGPEVLNSLYDDLTYQCSCCGTRFEQTGQLAKHLDVHFKHNIYLRERQTKHEFRQPLLSVESWIKSEKITSETNRDVFNVYEEEEKDEFYPDTIRAQDFTKSECHVCREIFTEVWDEEKQCWLLSGAIKVKFEDDQEDNQGKLKTEGGENGTIASNMDSLSEKQNGASVLMHQKCYQILKKDQEEKKQMQPIHLK